MLVATGMTTVEKIVAIVVIGLIAYGAFMGKGKGGRSGGSSTPSSGQ